jgi:hypothetical protein
VRDACQLPLRCAVLPQASLVLTMPIDERVRLAALEATTNACM